MLVKDVMRTDVITVSPFTSLRDAIALMREKNLQSIVVDKKDKHDAYGMLTYTTVLQEIVADDGDIDLLNVYDVYAKPALTVSKELNIKVVAKMMVNQKYKRLLVTESNELIGIISMTDIVDTIFDMVDAGDS